MEQTHSFALSATALKLLALAAMTADHIGVLFFLGADAFRIVGRLAFPIFAFMIAEGCRYTRSMARYLGSIALLAFVCQLVYFFVERSLYMCVLVVFTLAIPLILLWQAAVEKPALALAALAYMGGVYLLCEHPPELLAAHGFAIDYGFCGVMLPVLISLSREKWPRLAFTALGLCLLGITMGGVQWWGLAALVPLALYNGQRGRFRLKYLFYLYYPLHLAALEGLHRLLT